MIRHAARLTGAAGATAHRLAPVVLALLALATLELSGAAPAPELRDVSDAPRAGRLVLFQVDSLALEDMDPGSKRMARLKARLPTGLHGPARQCADAVSVPCFTAMATGRDHFSLFSLVRNFGGVGRLPPGNLFEALQARGKRVGFIGDVMFEKAVERFDWVEIPDELDDAYTIRRALEVFERDGLDVVVVHIRETDVTTHTNGPDSPEYEAALEQADRLIDEAMERFPPDVHVSVFGDHGHTADGRHFAGLDVPTYASFFGPAFRRTAEHPMAITDYGALWARVFGVEFSGEGWVDAYFSGAPLPTADGLPSTPGGGRPPPAWALAAVGLLILLVAAPWRWRPAAGHAWSPLLLSGLLLGAAMLALGLGWTELRPLISYKGRWTNVGMGLALSMVGAAALWPAWRRAHPSAREGTLAGVGPLVVGAVLLSLPTVYKYGGVANTITPLVIAFGLTAVVEIRHKEPRRALLAVVAVGVAWALWNPAVRNFKLLWFGIFSEQLADVALPVSIGLAATAVLVAARPTSPGGRPAEVSTGTWLAAGAGGLALAALGPVVPPAAWILPCVGTPILLAVGWRRPWAAPLVLLLGIPALAFFFRHDPQRLAPTAAALGLWPLWARSRAPRASQVEAAATLLVLVLTTLWATFGARISGIDFTYYFQWLPAGTAFKETWASNAALTLALYLSVPAFGLMLARRAAPESVDRALHLAWGLARARLALCLLFITGFAASGGAGPFISSDVLQSAAIWCAVLLVLLLAPGPGALESAGDGAPFPTRPQDVPAVDFEGACAPAVARSGK